jgi:hypothetical protein
MSGKPLNMPVERFFASIRFEQREKLTELPLDWSNVEARQLSPLLYLPVGDESIV